MRERAFAAALKQLSELPDEEYVGLLAGLAAKGVVHGTGGGHSVPEGPGALWQAGGHPGQREAGRRPFDPVCPDPAIRGGLILSDGDVEVNCTFETLVRLLRGEMDRTVVEVLFG